MIRKDPKFLSDLRCDSVCNFSRTIDEIYEDE